VFVGGGEGAGKIRVLDVATRRRRNNSGSSERIRRVDGRRAGGPRKMGVARASHSVVVVGRQRL